MPVDFSEVLVIGVSSRALFDLEEEKIEKISKPIEPKKVTTKKSTKKKAATKKAKK